MVDKDQKSVVMIDVVPSDSNFRKKYEKLEKYHFEGGIKENVEGKGQNYPNGSKSTQGCDS